MLYISLFVNRLVLWAIARSDNLHSVY